MDSASANAAPGVDPNLFPNTYSAFADLAWDHNAFDSLPELDSYQDSNEGDAELFDLLSAPGPPSRDSLGPSVVDATGLGPRFVFSERKNG